MPTEFFQCCWMSRGSKMCPRKGLFEAQYKTKSGISYTVRLCEQHEAEFKARFPESQSPDQPRKSEV